MRDRIICKTYVFGVAALVLTLIAPLAHCGQSPKLSATELKAIYETVGLKERGGKFVDECDQPVQPETKVIDLNGDGKPEVFVLVGSSCYGNAGGELSLLIKNERGRWESNLGVPAGGYKVLGMKNKGYPDIEIGGPGSCLPVWRWNGAKYAIYRRCNR